MRLEPSYNRQQFFSKLNRSQKMAMKKNWEILHIPDKILFKPDEQPTMDVFASVIEPKLTNTLVRKLIKVAPMENYRHIKRVWKKKSVEGGDFQLILILCLVGENGNELESIPDDVFELINAHQLSPFVAKVHKYAAISREEWSEQCKLWPTSYHPPIYNIEGITGFNEEDSDSVFHFMKMALELTKVGRCTDEVVNAAVIVDPSTKQVIASANDQTYQASTSTVIDTSFASGSIEQKDTASSHQSDADAVVIKEAMFSNSSLALGENKESYTGVSCLYPWNWTEQNSIAGNAYSWHPLRHAALVAIEHASSRDMRLFPGSLDPEEKSIDQVNGTMSSPNSSPAKRQKYDFTKDVRVLKTCSNGGSHSEGGEMPYLCTGCDIFVAWEPCTMCAMALVHQRIRRIFYAFPNPNCGALGSVYRLQGEKSLNHHYAVFRVLLPEESLKM